MSENSGIQWTTHTFNPWWGCVKVAQGCKHCYAEGVAQRFHGHRIWGPGTDRKIASEKVWNDPHRWNKAAERAGERAKVFCLSMGDCLEDHPGLIEPRKRLVGIVESTPWLDWQLLTKRPENADMFGWGRVWPANVWFGASAAIHSEMIRNAPHLLNVPARVKFWSLEPLCGEIVMTPACMGDWVIVGGESGQGARPMDVMWVRSIVRACADAGVPCFVKQLGARPMIGDMSDPYGWPTNDGPVNWDTGEIVLKDAKGGDISEWPNELRVRQFPSVDSPPTDPEPGGLFSPIPR